MIIKLIRRNKNPWHIDLLESKFIDPCRSSYSHRRTASPRLPSVKNRRGSKAVDDTSAVGNLLASSLTSLTLGSLGLGGDGDGGDQVSGT